MKKSLVALALFGAFAGVVHAQSAVVIYGTLDAGVSKTDGNPTANNTTKIGKRDNNKLGFKGVEDLGNGLNALFQLEMRYEPDTGTNETNAAGVQRPLFQGQSRVGVQSAAFGTVRLGRGLTAFQESITAFDPWNGIQGGAGFVADLQVAGYTSDPLLLDSGTSKNRFSNALFYNTPVMSGFQVNATVATKEGTTLVPTAPVIPYSVSATFNQAQFAALLAYERNAVATKLWSVAASFKPIEALKLTASFQRHDADPTGTFLTAPRTKSWIVGANYTMGPGKFLAGYGRKTPTGVEKTKQASLGYEYSLSKRTYVYADISNKKTPRIVNALTNATVSDSVNFYGVGVHHNF